MEKTEAKKNLDAAIAAHTAAENYFFDLIERNASETRVALAEKAVIAAERRMNIANENYNRVK